MNMSGTTVKLEDSMEDFKVGDKVLLREDSEWNNGREANPLEIEGAVIAIEAFDEDWIVVDWGESVTNSYKSKDLIHCDKNVLRRAK